MRKLGVILLVALLVFSAIGIAGCGKKTDTTSAGSASEAVINVNTTRVTNGPLQENITLSGKLDALNLANVVAKAPGKVAKLLVDVGSRVAAGQTMIVLESEDLAASLASAQAGVESAQVSLDLASSQYERGKALFIQGTITQADYENNYEGPWKKAEVGLKTAQASLAQARAKYNDAMIKSPLAGVVTARNINVGELAGSSSPLITVMSLDTVVVMVNVNEDQVNKLKVGQDVKVKVSAVSDTPFAGKISNIALAANTSSKVFPVKIQINNKDHMLKPGMFADVTFSWTEKPGLLVPLTSVVDDNGSHKVFVIENNIARAAKVDIGKSDAKNTQVLSGLNEGELVVVTVPDALKDGGKVSTQ
ncbi:MAG: efflux RND transporter periplasmic adaptor subunit [Candidatus Saccharibacteria bacterium]